jgi:hypothetical protein
MRKRPLTQDAKLLAQLDRLRKEPAMRRARQWWLDEFSPKSAGDYLEIELAHGTHESQWLKQVATYWGMATSFVLDGTLSEEAFLKPEFSREMFTVFAKIQAFLKQLRERTGNPDFMANVERFILQSRAARKQLKSEIQRRAALTKKRK